MCAREYLAKIGVAVARKFFEISIVVCSAIADARVTQLVTCRLTILCANLNLSTQLEEATKGKELPSSWCFLHANAVK